MRAQEFITEYKKSREDFEGMTIEMTKNGHVLVINALDDWGNNVLGSVAFNIGDNNDLDPQDLKVDERYQGQGIARAMYDYAKSKGYTIHRSYDQTPAGAGFWNKHRGEDVRVWETSTQSVAERKKSRKKKSSRHGGYFFPGYGYYGSSGDAGEGGGDGGGGESRSDMAEGQDKAQAVRRIQKMLNDRFDANLDVDGVLGPLTQKSINRFMPSARPAPADDPDKTTAVQGRQQKNTSQEEQLDELSFLGSQCTKDCSGHRAGYEWSKRKGLRQANSWSPSFNKGAGLAVAGK